jgi:predicted HTH transcriptional regulator|tara:strand:- start:255 stop:599 length:345 start_codon:yes stop_codon:yes gene_type:complete
MKYDRLDEQHKYHEYTLKNGDKILRYQLLKLIKDIIGVGKMTTSQITKIAGIDQQVISNLVRYLCTKGVLGSEKKQRSNLYYVLEDECLLAKLYYPLSMLKQFKIIGRKIHRAK